MDKVSRYIKKHTVDGIYMRSAFRLSYDYNLSMGENMRRYNDFMGAMVDFDFDSVNIKGGKDE